MSKRKRVIRAIDAAPRVMDNQDIHARFVEAIDSIFGEGDQAQRATTFVV